jgi:RNA polymerase sigma-70 factor (ECF subfamily)
MRPSQILQGLFSARDEQFMWRVKLDDDHHAFAELMRRWQRPIENLCARMLSDSDRAQDVAQIVFARVFSRRADWEPTAKFSTFLWRIALNLCRDDLRGRQRRRECSLEEWLDTAGPELLDNGQPTPDTAADIQERADLVRNALFKLAPQHREVVVLRHYEQLKFCEIAEVLEIPEGTVKSRMAEALNQLSRLLGPLKEKNVWNNQSKELLAL